MTYDGGPKKQKKKYASQIDMLMPNWLLKLNSHLLNQEWAHYSCM